MIRYLRHEELLSRYKEICYPTDTHPGSTTNGNLDYVKLIIRRKPDILLIHSGTNHLTNNVNTMKKVRDLVKCVRNLDRMKCR